MRKIKIIFSIILIFVELIVLSVGIYVIRYIVEVNKCKLNLIPDDILINTLKDINVYKSFFTFHPLHLIGWIVIIMSILYLTTGDIVGIKVNKTYSKNDKYGSHGTARFQEKSEIKKEYTKDKIGWFMGNYKKGTYKLNMNGAYHKLNGDLNMQVLVIGSPGSDKTTGFVLPNIFHIAQMYKNSEEKADIIITDPKSELFYLTANHLERQGYEVRVLDFIHQKYGDCINPISFIENDKELMEIADGYISSIESMQGGGNKDKFWAEQESQVLGALIGFVLQTRSPEKQTFTEINKILTSEDVSSIEKAKMLFIKNNIEGAAKQLWNNFLMISDSERTRANILGGLATKLKLFAIEGIQDITNLTTIDIKKIGAKKKNGEKPIALFILMPDKDKTFSPIINVTVTVILNQLYKTAYKYKNKLYNSVYFLIEEMANIGRLPRIKEMLGTMRGRKIYPMLVFQSLSQMKERYPYSWEDMLSMCDTHIYLGVNDSFTSKYASNALGNTTIKIQGVTRKPVGMGVNSKTDSQNYTSRKLLLPEEIESFDNKKMIVRQRSKNPLVLYKIQYKYWEEKNRICEDKNLIELDLIKSKLYKIEQEINTNENIKIRDYNKEKLIEEHEKEVEKKLKDNVIEFRQIEEEKISGRDRLKRKKLKRKEEEKER